MNLAALLIIAVLSAFARQRVNLCRVILLYYLAYFAISYTPGVSATVYYAAQALLDAAVIMACCFLARRPGASIAPVLYAFFVYSSFLCEGIKFIDEAYRFYAFTELHKLRQSVSVPVDVLFAVVGSDGVRRILSFCRRAICVNIKDNNSDGEITKI